MKKYILAFFVFLSQLTNAAVQVSITDGISNASVKAKMEKTMSAFLTEANAAQAQRRALDFGGLGISTTVQESVSMLWENSPFECTDEEIVEHCILTGSGYQVRNIPLMMRPTDENFNEEEYQEAVFSFDKNGNMESFYLSISMNQYLKIIKSNLEVTDLRRRQLILDYVERFRTSYNQKDLAFLNQVFSNDALIITGKVIKQSKDGVRLPDKIGYNKRSKQEYLANLKRQFARTKYIKVTFDDVEIRRSPDVNVYGVTVRQGYTTDNYHDDGYVFMVWNFSNEDAPKIFVRTWQPELLNGKTLPKEEVFSLADFDF